MQAAEQLLGLRVVGGLYQPLSGETCRRAGRARGDSEPRLDCVATDRLEPDELASCSTEALAAARDRGRRGRRAARSRRGPSTCAGGGGCSYPTICRCER